MTTTPGATPAARPLLEMRKISKSFFGVKVLDEVTIDLLPGEVLALVGENGAGKSTLIKILNGDYQKDGGEIAIDGEVVAIAQPARRRGAGHPHDLPGIALRPRSLGHRKRTARPPAGPRPEGWASSWWIGHAPIEWHASSYACSK